MTIRVLLADDHQLFRDTLALGLAQEPELTIVGGARDGLEVQEQVATFEPDVVLMDLEMPLADGLHATRNLTRTHPQVKIIMLTAHTDEGNVLQALAAGARGYLPKTVLLVNLITVIKQVNLGQIVVDTTLLRGVVGELHRLRNVESKTRPRPVVGLAALSVAELNLLAALESGRSNKEIGVHMHQAESTIKNRLSIMFKKIGVQDRAQAVIYGLRHGITPDGNPMWSPTDDTTEGLG